MTSTPEKPLGNVGVKTVRRTLADGTVKEYRYSRKARRPREPDGALRKIFNDYSESPEFKRLVPAWRERKLWLYRLIEDELGWMTRQHLEDRRARDEFYSLRDKHSKYPDRADKMMQAMSSALQWAYDRGRIAVNHARGIKALAARSQPKHYTIEQEATLLATLPDDLRRLYLVALYTGLRRADLCRLRWADLKPDGWLTIQPAKTSRSTGVYVHLPTFALPPLAEVLAELSRSGPHLLSTESGRAWTEFNVSQRWQRYARKAGIEGTWFNEIRHTTATRLIEAGCTEAERGAIMGHAVAMGAGASYAVRTKQLALNAYRKWATWLEHDGAEVIDLRGQKWRSQK